MASTEDTGIAGLVDELSGASRRKRQEAAHAIAQTAREDVAAVVPFADQLVDALQRPEAQTRWEVLDALSEVAQADPAKAEPAFEGAEESLFDDDSATVRLAAFVFLCRLGATSAERSASAWPLIDEAIQCYHGDAEYRDMLAALLGFAQGELAADVKTALAERVSFDAENGVGYIKSYSAEVAEALKA